MVSYLKKYFQEDYKYDTKINSCAYKFLQTITDIPIISFNYTDPFDKLGLNTHNILHVHGSLVGDFHKVLLGVDRNVIKENKTIKDNAKLMAVVKSSRHNKTPDILRLLNDSSVIVFYGHSLNITDSDYFRSFFDNIANNNSKCNKLFIVTKDNTGLEQIKNNLKEWDVDYNRLLNTNTEIRPIYTINGAIDPAFEKLLNNI